MKTKKRKTFIIEHLEPKLWPWCIFEYEHISKIVGKKNLWFTNIKKIEDRKKLSKFGRVFSESVRDIKINSICVLDPESKETLKTKDCKRFDYYIFGGILGDYPPKKRTKKELTRFIRGSFKTKNIGKEQMSTDNAVFCVKQIINGQDFRKMRFIDNISVKINEFESIDLPYRYNLVKDKALISSKIIRYLKKKKSF